jgi:hypothetical protein
VPRIYTMHLADNVSQVRDVPVSHATASTS